MAKHMQKHSRKVVNSNPPPTRQPYPAVSVVIPMYNAEKYIADCLESLLAQTFKNYEVIVVDDCSTDSSPAIVESYIPKFGGRLTLSYMEKNSGGAAMPCNKGLFLSRGEYVFLMGNDDLVTKTAFEELYTLAKDYDADVVYCEKYYCSKDDGTFLGIEPNQSGTFVDKPTFETDNMEERVQNILNRKYRVPQWLKLARRSLIFEHEIFFSHCSLAEDTVWTYGLVFYAKKFLLVPNIVYIYRLSENSITRSKKTVQQNLIHHFNPCIFGLKSIDNLISKHEFFQQNPQYRYAILEHFASTRFKAILDSTGFQLPPFVVYETIKQEFGDKFGEQDVLVSVLCTLLNTQQKISIMNQQRFNQFAAQAQEQVKKFNQFAAQAQARIAELEAQLKTK